MMIMMKVSLFLSLRANCRRGKWPRPRPPSGILFPLGAPSPIQVEGPVIGAEFCPVPMGLRELPIQQDMNVVWGYSALQVYLSFSWGPDLGLGEIKPLINEAYSSQFVQLSQSGPLKL